MKTLITAMILFLFCVQSYSQIKGYTQTGRLIPLKEEIVKKAIDNEPPVIKLEQPNVLKDASLIVNSDSITVEGSVYDESDSVSLFINNTKEILADNNVFRKVIKLNVGFNHFEILALDKYMKVANYNFDIDYVPILTKPEITLIEPAVDENNQANVSERLITIRGMVKSKTTIDKIIVNDKNILLLDNNEFYTNQELIFGKNIITIKAYDTKGDSSEKKLAINWTPDITGPVIKILDPPASRGIKAVSKSDVIILKGQALDESGVFNVTVNDREALLYPNGDFNIKMYLQDGDNQLIVKAIDKKSNAAIDTFYITRKAAPLITSGKYIALVIGINSYHGYWPKLANAVNDAEGVAKTLKNDYMFDTVITVLDKQATRRNIIHELEELTNNIKSEDNLLIYYSGHGQFKKELNKGYWVPVDATTNSIADFISNNEIKTFMGGIKTRHTLLVSDACFAGDIFRGRPTESIKFDPNNMERYYKEVYSKTSRIAITSGGLEEVQDAGKDGHSIFTYYFLKSLNDNKSKYFDATQLFNDFRIAVTNNSEQTPLLQVVRDTGDEGGQFVFVRR